MSTARKAITVVENKHSHNARDHTVRLTAASSSAMLRAPVVAATAASN